MYNNYVLFLIGLFVFTILIQYLDKQLEQKQEQEQKEGFKRRRLKKTFKKAGKSIKKVATSPAGIAVLSIGAGLLCGPVCAAAVAGGLGGNIAAIKAENKRKKKRYKRDRNREHKRRCRVLTGRENPHYNGKSRHFEGKESILNPCREFRESNCANQESVRCNYLNTQCRLARSCTFYDSHLIDQGQSGGIEESNV